MPKETRSKMTEDDRIRGKVAAILTLSELVINRGSADGVQIGMQFAVLNSQGIDVKDPDTGEVLGSTEIVKTVVKIVRYRRRAPVSRPDVPHDSREAGALDSFAMGALTGMTGTPDRVETLETSQATLKQELSQEDSFVKIGDPVVQAKEMSTRRPNLRWPGDCGQVEERRSRGTGHQPGGLRPGGHPARGERPLLANLVEWD